MSKEWNGEGVPPVGAHCEVAWGPQTTWVECVLLPDFQIALKYSVTGWNVTPLLGLHGKQFRPLKSPREREIEAIEDAIGNIYRHGSMNSIAKAVYDAGYRKTEGEQ